MIGFHALHDLRRYARERSTAMLGPHTHKVTLISIISEEVSRCVGRRIYAQRRLLTPRHGNDAQEEQHGR